jgi:hypothetical protein
MHHPLRLVLGLLIYAVAQSLRAEIILDDFDDPAEVVSHEMEEQLVTSLAVGDLSATRRMRIAVGQTNVAGSFDANYSTDSALTARLQGHAPTPNASQPLFSYQFNYEFPASDIGENGANDALIFEFLSTTGTESPLLLQFGLWDETHPGTIFLGRIENLPLNSGPFSARFPFTSFTTRAGGQALPDFTSVYRIEFSFFFLNPPEDIHWSGVLDRVSISHLPVPEPTAWQLATMTVTMIAVCARA